MTVVRLFNTVGPRQTGRYGMVVPTLVRQALDGRPLTVYGDGSQTRCFAHVWDTVAGILVAARSSSGLSTIGVGLELQAIAAVVIGGTLLTGGSGSMMGTLAGVLLLNVINNVINQVGTLSSYFQQVVSGVFLIVVVLIQRYLSREQRL